VIIQRLVPDEAQRAYALLVASGQVLLRQGLDHWSPPTPLASVPAKCRLSSRGGSSSMPLGRSLSSVPPRCPWRVLRATVPALELLRVPVLAVETREALV
jgi:hypothetical protein